MLRARGRGGGIEVWSSGPLEAGCNRVGVEVQRNGALELRRCAVSVRRGEGCLKRSGDALQACCGCRDV